MRVHAAALALTVAFAGLGGCSALHRDKPTGKLAAARVAVQNAEAHSDYSGTALTDLDAARHYLQQAEAAGKNGDPGKDRENLAYAAEQLATAAMARRESMLLQDKEARDREAKMALHRAETAEMEAERARKLVESRKQ